MAAKSEPLSHHKNMNHGFQQWLFCCYLPGAPCLTQADPLGSAMVWYFQGAQKNLTPFPTRREKNPIARRSQVHGRGCCRHHPRHARAAKIARSLVKLGGPRNGPEGESRRTGPGRVFVLFPRGEMPFRRGEERSPRRKGVFFFFSPPEGEWSISLGGSRRNESNLVLLRETTRLMGTEEK